MPDAGPIQSRNQFAYLFNHEFGLYLGRFCGCGLFIATAAMVSDVFALKYALLLVGVIHLFSLPVARIVVRGAAEAEQAERGHGLAMPVR